MPILPENDTSSKTRLLINSKPENKVSYLSFTEQCEEKGPITFEVRPDPDSRVSYQIRVRAFHILEISK